MSPNSRTTNKNSKQVGGDPQKIRMEQGNLNESTKASTTIGHTLGSGYQVQQQQQPQKTALNTMKASTAMPTPLEQTSAKSKHSPSTTTTAATSHGLKWIGHKSKNTLNGCLQSPADKGDASTVAETVVPSTQETEESYHNNNNGNDSRKSKNHQETKESLKEQYPVSTTPVRRSSKKQQQKQQQNSSTTVQKGDQRSLMNDSSYQEALNESYSSSFSSSALSSSTSNLNNSFKSNESPRRNKYYTPEKAYITPLATRISEQQQENNGGGGCGDLASRMALVLPSSCFLPPSNELPQQQHPPSPSSDKLFLTDIDEEGIAPRGKTCFSGCNPFRKSQHSEEKRLGTTNTETKKKKTPFLSLSDRSARRQGYTTTTPTTTITTSLQKDGQSQHHGTPQTTILVSSTTTTSPPLPLVPTSIGVVGNGSSNTKKNTTHLMSSSLAQKTPPRPPNNVKPVTMKSTDRHTITSPPIIIPSSDAEQGFMPPLGQQFSDDPPGDHIKDKKQSPNKNKILSLSFDDPEPFQPRLEESTMEDNDSNVSRAPRGELSSVITPTEEEEEYDPEVEVVVLELDAKADSKKAEYLKLARLREVPKTIVLDVPMRPVSPLHFMPPKKQGFVRQDCLCGHNDECNGISAGFFLVEDARSGYVKVPKKKRITSQSVLNANRHRERLLFHIAKLAGQQQRYNGDDDVTLYIAKHHFHPQIVFSQPNLHEDNVYEFPYHITTKLADDLCIPLTERDRVRENFDQHMTDFYFTVPTYNIDRAKRDLKTRVRASRLTVERQEEEKDRKQLTKVFSATTKAILSIKDNDGEDDKKKTNVEKVNKTNKKKKHDKLSGRNNAVAGGNVKDVKDDNPNEIVSSKISV